MTNTNCLEQIACPQCGNDSMIYIEARTMAVLTDDGAETFGHIEWDVTSYTECPECGKHGPLGGFRIQPTKEQSTDILERSCP